MSVQPEVRDPNPHLLHRTIVCSAQTCQLCGPCPYTGRSGTQSLGAVGRCEGPAGGRPRVRDATRVGDAGTAGPASTAATRVRLCLQAARYVHTFLVLRCKPELAVTGEQGRPILASAAPVASHTNRGRGHMRACTRGYGRLALPRAKRSTGILGLADCERRLSASGPAVTSCASLCSCRHYWTRYLHHRRSMHAPMKLNTQGQ